jgi:hypothetical protein
MFADGPNLFCSHVESGFDQEFVDRLEEELKARSVYLYRLVRDKRIGEDWRKVAGPKILAADGMLSLWSARAARSGPMADEVRFAIDHQVPVCLIRQPLVDRPKEWGDDVIEIRLQGVDRLLTLEYNILPPWSWVKPALSELVADVVTFAWRSHSKKVARTATQPSAPA